MHAVLKRVSESIYGTHGVFLVDDVPRAVTLEPPWLDNKRNVSCIPVGAYACRKHLSPRHGDCFLLSNVENRSNILIHSGNSILNTQGCILVGNSLQKRGSFISGSREALKELLEVLPVSFNLIIVEV